MRFLSSALLVLFLVGWVLWFWPYDDLLDRSGTPLGADFSMFYVAGQMTIAGETEQLYDQAAHQNRLHQLFSGIRPEFALPYRYPPLVALAMAPLACLPYVVAVGIFLATGLTSALIGIRMLVRQSGGSGWSQYRLGFLVLLGWPVLLETWIGGQASLFALLIISAGIVCLQRERYFWSGAIFALASYKPNVLLLVVIGCVLFRPRILRGLLPVGAVLLALNYWAAGWEGLRAYVELTLQLAAGPWDVETPYWKVHGLAQWLTLLLGGHARLVSLVLGLLATASVVWRWRTSDNAPTALLPYALLITINALANPYTPIYDLTLLSAGLVLMVPTLTSEGRYPLVKYGALWQVVLALFYLGPHLSQLAAKSTGLQFFPLGLLAFAIFQARLFWLETRASGDKVVPLVVPT